MGETRGWGIRFGLMSEANGDNSALRDARLVRLRRVARPWRIAFAIYALALTTGTHWPRLTLGPEIPATDKMIHMVAFAGLTVLLWRTKWFAHRWVVGIVCFAWAALDEISQGIPMLNRTVSTHDIVANALGVFTAIVWLWALMPMGVAHGANRARLKLHGFITDEMFVRWSAWLAVIGGLIAGGAPLWMMWSAMPVERLRMAIVIAVAVAIVVTLLLWMRLWQRRREEVHATMPCLECGTRVSTMDFVHGGGSMCGVCDATIDPTLWITRSKTSARQSRISMSTSFALMIKPALLGLAALVVGFGLIFALPVVYEVLLSQRSPGSGSGVSGGALSWAPRIAHMVGTLPRELIATIDLTAYLVLLAVVVRVYRTGLAKYHDRAVSCRRCGHDLRGTPTIEGTNGQGRCGECGTAFVRAT